MSNSTKKSLIFILMFLISTFLFSTSVFADVPNVSSYNVTLYSCSNGIPTGEANTVLQTGNGFIWCGGYGGLLRYDGVSFEQMCDEENGLTSYSIRSLWESSDGTLWIGSNDQGAFWYDGISFHSVNPESSGRCLSVRCFSEDLDGTVWLGTADGLAYIENGTVIFFDLKDFDYSNSTIYSLSPDQSGNLWAVDNNGCIICIDPISRNVEEILSPEKNWDSGIYVYTAKVCRDGLIYAGTNSDVILCIDPSSNFSCSTIDTGNIICVNSICETEEGDLWFAADNGLGMLSDGQFSDLSYLDYAEHLLNVTEDYEHNIWVTSSKHGLLYVQKSKIETLTQIPELQGFEVYTIYPYNGVWYVGSENGLVCLDENFNKIDNPMIDTLSGIIIRQIISDSEGNLYFGTYFHGLYVYNTKTGDVSNIALSNSKIRTIQILSDSTIAVGTSGSLEILSGGEIVNQYQTGINVLCILELTDGSVLVGTDGDGIFKYENDSLVPYAGISNGLSGGVILRIREDTQSPGNVWVSCGTNIFYGNEKDGFRKSVTINTGNGSIVDFFVLDDYILLLRSSGIILTTQEDLRDVSTDLDPDIYIDENDGIPGPLVANSWNYFDGNVFYLCTTNGIGILDKNNVYLNDIPPKCIISDIEFSDGSVWDGKDIVELDKNLVKLSFNFAALTFSGNDPRIEYWLEGLDKEPVIKDVKQQHSAEYTNLSGGTYKFHLRAYNNDWCSGNETVITLVKNQKFTETKWFYVSIGLAAAAIASGIALIRILQIKKKQKLYKMLTDQSITTISKAVDAKDPYTQGHSKRVADFSVELGKHMGFSKEQCENLYYVALLHDIGKIGVPDEILKKPSKLTDEEYNTIKTHTIVGAKILSDFTVLKEAIVGALYHHERYDGKGYCNGLKGKDIPEFSRIICVADAYDAMTSSRCYRPGLSTEEVISELEKGRGTQFDPDIAELAVKLIKEHGLTGTA